MGARRWEPTSSRNEEQGSCRNERDSRKASNQETKDQRGREPAQKPHSWLDFGTRCPLEADIRRGENHKVPDTDDGPGSPLRIHENHKEPKQLRFPRAVGLEDFVRESSGK